MRFLWGAAIGAAIITSAWYVTGIDQPKEVVAQPKAEAVKTEQPKTFQPCRMIPLSYDLQRFTKEQADLNGVPYVLVLAVMEQESRFDIHADGGDSFGLMQINEVHGPKEIIIQPEENIKIGCWLLGYLWQEYRDWNKALVAYNCGEAGAYQQYFRHGSISSPYSREVLLRSERFAELLHEESVLRPRR